MQNNKTILQLALMILNNQCPPDNRAYLCKQGEECEEDCPACWSNYLFYAANGYRGRPYAFDYRSEENI